MKLDIKRNALWSAWPEDDCDSDPRIDPMAQKITEWFVGRWPRGAEEPECRILIGEGRSAEIIARRIAEKLTSVLNTDAIPDSLITSSVGEKDGWVLVPVNLTDRMLEDCGQFLPPTSTLSYCYDCFREAWAAALAARPEAPSDAGWSREDLEAFVAREWPEGRSAGAAARELVRALGVRGLAPTLQRLLTDLLGQINFASTDRAQILADFANAAPEAARMAKIDSFERWNPRVFDPTPPSDPAPSGQAEG
ncbi:hypothetical protein [Methylorubrum extorquens]|nr:hypothetical protein [Methylorubrum extorquens]MCP1545362.1 hypothetical protein [Methylorubrum extorquens]MCP1587291.1 hypothetical protein [Methylorubrum extorquens]